jgi:hypothetical protein
MNKLFGQLTLPNSIPRVEADQSAIQVGINFILQLAGVLSLIFIIIGAVKFSTSGGDPQKVASARNTVIYALVGLVVAVTAFTIASIVGQEARSVAGASNPFFGAGGIVTVVADWLSWVVGVASVIGVIYGALKYITSAGQAQSAQAGRNAIIYSIVGIIVAVTAQFIVTFVLERI